MLDHDTRRLLIEQLADTLNRNLHPMLAEIVTAMTRPSVLYRPTLNEMGGKWYAQYPASNNPIAHFAASGNTAAEAMANFDRLWTTVFWKEGK